MKPITKYLAAGSMAAILLFSYKERSTIKSFFAPETKEIQQVANTKAIIPAETVAQFSEATPVEAEPVTAAIPVVVKAKKSTHHQSQFIPAKETVVINEPVLIAEKADNNNVVEEKNTIEENKTEAEISPVLVRTVQSSKPTVKKIDVSKLAKSMSPEKINAHLQAVVFSDDFVMQDETENSSDVTINEPVKTEVVNVMKGHKMAGNAFEGFTAASTKAQSPSDLTGFAMLRQADKGADSYTYSSVYEGSEQLKEYAVRSGNNSDYAIIVNLGLKSGKRRFFVVDLTTNTIVKSGVVAEGRDVAANDKKYSNEIGSTATSLGIYKIGQRIKTDSVSGYRLLGLQESNSNAYARAMMLKATEDVPYDEISFPVLKTDGSLSLSSKFLAEISPLIDKSTKPVLLWAYDQSADMQASNSSVSKN